LSQNLTFFSSAIVHLLGWLIKRSNCYALLSSHISYSVVNKFLAKVPRAKAQSR
jgi:hypothetical protein